MSKKHHEPKPPAAPKPDVVAPSGPPINPVPQPDPPQPAVIEAPKGDEGPKQ